MAIIMLVAGGGWSWWKLAPLLRAAGHTVYTPTVTGQGERAHLLHPEITLETYIQDVVGVLEVEDLRAVTLVGWSDYGMVMTGVADRVPERVVHLIYLDAHVPEDGQAAVDVQPGGRAWLAEARAAAEQAGTPGYLPPPVESIRQMVPDETDQVWMLSRLTPLPFGVLEQPIRLQNPQAQTLRRTYIRCTDGLDSTDVEPPYLSRLRADPAWEYRELASTHLAPVIAPRETADLLLSLL